MQPGVFAWWWRKGATISSRTARDRVSIAVNGRECRAGEKVELPPLKLIGGGFISGQAIDTTTRRSVSVTEVGEPVTLGLYGPAQPQGAVTVPTGETVVDKAGRFTVRAAPGENFPYFSTRQACTWPGMPGSSHRSSSRTERRPSIICSSRPRLARRKNAGGPETRRGLVEGAVRSDGEILLEFRKLGHTVDEEELGACSWPSSSPSARRGAPTGAASSRPNHRRQGAAPIGIRLAGDRRSSGRAGFDPGHPQDLAPQQQRLRADRRRQGIEEFMQTHDLNKGREANISTSEGQCANSSGRSGP